MPEYKVASEFDKIIQENRLRKKNEELANQIFGRNKQNDANKKDNRRNSRPASLASRVGIAKRSSSASSNTSPRPQLSRPSSHANQSARQNRLASEIDKNANANIVSSPKPTSGSGLSIKGSAAPFVVEARNFAAGTTDADIESAIQPDCTDSSGINTLVSCKIIQNRPTVAAELVFSDRIVAETVIAKYHNQRADGQTLDLKLTRSGPGSMSKQPKKQFAPQQNIVANSQNSESDIAVEDPSMMEDIDMDAEPVQEVPITTASYENEREAAERDRLDRDSRRERDDYDIANRKRADDRRRATNTIDRNRDASRDDNRERDREHDRDNAAPNNRSYDGRDRDDSRSYTRRDESGPNRSSHYGNGVGGAPPRSSYGGGYAGGRGGYPGYNSSGGPGAGGYGSSRGGYGGGSLGGRYRGAGYR